MVNSFFIFISEFKKLKTLGFYGILIYSVSFVNAVQLSIIKLQAFYILRNSMCYYHKFYCRVGMKNVKNLNTFASAINISAFLTSLKW